MHTSLDMDAEHNYDEGIVEEDDSDYEDDEYEP